MPSIGFSWVVSIRWTLARARSDTENLFIWKGAGLFRLTALFPFRNGIFFPSLVFIVRLRGVPGNSNNSVNLA